MSTVFNNSRDFDRTLNFQNITAINLKGNENYIPPVPLASWNWFNQGGATARDDYQRLSLSIPPQVNRVRGLSRTLNNALTGVYDVRGVMAVIPSALGVCGLALYSASNEILLLTASLVIGSESIDYYATPTSAPVIVSGLLTYWGYSQPFPIWYRWFADGVDLYALFSLDGITWQVVYTEPIGTTIIPNRWGIAGDARDASFSSGATIYSAEQFA